VRQISIFDDFDALIGRLVAAAPTFNSIPSWFRGTPAGQQALEEADVSRIGGRRDLVAELDAIAQERRRELAPVNKALPAARKRLAEAEAELRDARKALADLEVRAFGIAGAADRRCEAILADLRVTADPLIVAFVQELRAEWERTRKTSPDRAEYGRENLHGQRPRVNNRESITERLDGLRAAINASEALKLEVLGRPAVVERLRAIHAAIPELRPAESFFPSGHERATLPIASPPEPVNRKAVELTRYGRPK
jgi:hypothetical protein